ncbi:MAG: diadenylate cyclase CdaA [Erysipelotrichia bacterium]|nr:diadenylate cyclase CdaA [Erysipelotrichia bacterium]
MHLTYETIIRYLRIVIDIIAVWTVLNYLIKIVRTNQKTIQLFQGVILVIVVQSLSKLLGLKTVEWLADTIVSWGFLAIIVIFQPEIRQILERLGKSNALARIAILTSGEKENLVDELVTATANLSAKKVGALITLEQSHSLSEYINTGIRMNSLVSAELLCSIFMTTTPLHDGAVIIQGDKLACASAYFPPTTMDLPSKYGARHRAAIGISEITDAVTIVVSEETGTVSVAEQGKLIQMTEKKLREYLDRIILNKEVVQGESKKNTRNVSVSLDELVSNLSSDLDFKDDEDNELKNVNKHDMKLFQTASFKTVDLEKNEESSDNLVEKVVKNTLSENSVDDNIVIRKVAVEKDDSNSKPTIKTTVTTGTDKFEPMSSDKEDKQ